jgi:hypothetical protein
MKTLKPKAQMFPGLILIARDGLTALPARALFTAQSLAQANRIVRALKLRQPVHYYFDSPAYETMSDLQSC